MFCMPGFCFFRLLKIQLTQYGRPQSNHSICQRGFDQAATPAALEDAKAGLSRAKTDSLSALLKGMAKLSIEEKRARGAEINKAKREVETLLNNRREALAREELNRKLTSESVDITLPRTYVRLRRYSSGHENLDARRRNL